MSLQISQAVIPLFQDEVANVICFIKHKKQTNGVRI